MTTDKMNIEYWKQQLDEIWLNNIRYVHKGKDIDKIIEYAYIDLISQDRVENATASDFKRLVNSWLSNRRPPKENVKRDLSKL
jgi:hypothetical protein